MAAFQFSFPSNNAWIGTSNSGKSTLLERCLACPTIWEKPPDQIWYFYGIYTKNVENIMRNYPHVTAIQGLPNNVLQDPLSVFSPKDNNLMILDDLSDATQVSKAFTTFLTRATHHCNICLISLEHFLMTPSPERRSQTLQYHTVLLFKNPRNLYQIKSLARQTSLGSPKTIEYAYSDACRKPYGTLMLDFRQETAPEVRILTNIIASENEPTYVYC